MMDVIRKIKEIIAEEHTCYPLLTKHMLFHDGEVCYMNGSDGALGTDWQWRTNGRTCSFMSRYKNGWGFVRAEACSNDRLHVRVYMNMESEPVKEYFIPLPKGTAARLASVMYIRADKSFYYNAPIDKIFENEFYQEQQIAKAEEVSA